MPARRVVRDVNEAARSRAFHLPRRSTPFAPLPCPWRSWLGHGKMASAHMGWSVIGEVHDTPSCIRRILRENRVCTWCDASRSGREPTFSRCGRTSPSGGGGEMIPRVSISGFSILLALLLAIWEFYFFGFAGHRLFGDLEGTLGWFTPDRLGSNMAWL